jgi:hypothetical protein
MNNNCPECQFENGGHSLECSRYKECTCNINGAEDDIGHFKGCPALEPSLPCPHNFKYSHAESKHNRNFGRAIATKVDVVVCENCGEVRRD